MDIKEFEKMVNGHDLTYSYSDDHRVWQNGSAQHTRIRTAAKLLPVDDVKRIWNAKVDKALSEGYREPFYWKD